MYPVRYIVGGFVVGAVGGLVAEVGVCRFTRGGRYLVRWMGAHAPHLRFVHPSKQLVHHAIGQLLALGIICLGSTLALNAGAILDTVYYWTGLRIPHPLFDGMSYTVHAVGAMPLLTHAAKFWRLLLFEVEP